MELKMSLSKLTALGLALSLPALLGAGEPVSLTINVSGLRNTNGMLIACIHRDKAGFPTCQKAPSAIKQSSKISGAAMTVRFNGIAPGTYAVSLQHDEDGNGKLKTNFIGMPKEGVGISNNPGGIPGWSKSQFQLNGAATIAIKMRYL
jgi:uncharacterized protein (DUF2141 family)